jgi:hypothetical protein
MCMGYVGCGARGSCSMIGCVAQVCLKVHRWGQGHLHGTCCLTDGSYGKKVSWLLHVEGVLCFCSFHLCSEWQIHLITDCPLVNAARPSGPPLLSYYGVHGGNLHVECICGGMDAVAPLRTRSASSLQRRCLISGEPGDRSCQCS